MMDMDYLFSEGNVAGLVDQTKGWNRRNGEASLGIVRSASTGGLAGGNDAYGDVFFDDVETMNQPQSGMGERDVLSTSGGSSSTIWGANGSTTGQYHHHHHLSMNPSSPLNHHSSEGRHTSSSQTTSPCPAQLEWVKNWVGLDKTTSPATSITTFAHLHQELPLFCSLVFGEMSKKGMPAPISSTTVIGQPPLLYPGNAKMVAFLSSSKNQQTFVECFHPVLSPLLQALLLSAATPPRTDYEMPNYHITLSELQGGALSGGITEDVELLIKVGERQQTANNPMISAAAVVVSPFFLPFLMDQTAVRFHALEYYLCAFARAVFYPSSQSAAQSNGEKILAERDTYLEAFLSFMKTLLPASVNPPTSSFGVSSLSTLDESNCSIVPVYFHILEIYLNYFLPDPSCIAAEQAALNVQKKGASMGSRTVASPNSKSTHIFNFSGISHPTATHISHTFMGILVQSWLNVNMKFASDIKSVAWIQSTPEQLRALGLLLPGHVIPQGRWDEERCSTYTYHFLRSTFLHHPKNDEWLGTVSLWVRILTSLAAHAYPLQKLFPLYTQLLHLFLRRAQEFDFYGSVAPRSALSGQAPKKYARMMQLVLDLFTPSFLTKVLECEAEAESGLFEIPYGADISPGGVAVYVLYVPASAWMGVTSVYVARTIRHLREAKDRIQYLQETEEKKFSLLKLDHIKSYERALESLTKLELQLTAIWDVSSVVMDGAAATPMGSPILASPVAPQRLTTGISTTAVASLVPGPESQGTQLTRRGVQQIRRGYVKAVKDDVPASASRKSRVVHSTEWRVLVLFWGRVEELINETIQQMHERWMPDWVPCVTVRLRLLASPVNLAYVILLVSLVLFMTFWWLLY